MISHRFPLERIAEALELAAHPEGRHAESGDHARMSQTQNDGQMTAAVLYGSEDVKIERVPIPSIADDEVLLRVQVALTDGTDLKVWKQGFHARMIQPPALFGHELSGTWRRREAG